MPFDDPEIDAIIDKYIENGAALGRFPPPTRETVQVIDAVMELVSPLDLIDGKAPIEDEYGHIAMAVFHLRTLKIQNVFIVAFSGGAASRPNFDKIRAVMTTAPLLIALGMVGAPDDYVAFQFEYRMNPEVAAWPCAEPKALVVAERLGSIAVGQQSGAQLLGFACRWRASSQLATPHRLNIPFVETREAFMLPCEQCLGLFGKADLWPHIQV